MEMLIGSSYTKTGLSRGGVDLSSFVDSLLYVCCFFLALVRVECGDDVGSDSPVLFLVPHDFIWGSVGAAGGASPDLDCFATFENEALGKVEDHFAQLVDLSLDQPSIKILVLAFVSVFEDDVFAVWRAFSDAYRSFS